MRRPRASDWSTRKVVVTLATIGVLASAVGVWVTLSDRGPEGRSDSAVAPTSPVPRTGPDPEFRIKIPPLKPKPKPTREPKPIPVPQPGLPQRLVIPKLGVDSVVVPITAPGGVLTPPGDAQQLGWWSDGAEPGAAEGSALVTGHTLSRGGAALQDLESLKPGDRISVSTSNGRIVYRVGSVLTFSKGSVATQAQELFSQSVPGRLVVITCEDYNGSVYLSNVVVTATPLRPDGS